MPRTPAFLPPPTSQSTHLRLPPRCTSATPLLPPPRPPQRRSPPPKCPRPRTHAAAILRAARAGDLPLMERAVRAARADAFVLNAINYTTIAHAYTVGGQRARARATLAAMRATGVRPTNVTVRVAVRAGDGGVEVLQALQWVAREGTDAPDVRTWNMAMGAVARGGGEGNLAARVLEWMCEGVVEGGGMAVPHPTVCSFNTCMNALGRAGKVTEAGVVFARMLARGGVRPDVITYNTLLDMAISSQQSTLLGWDVEGKGMTHLCRPQQFVDAVVASMQRHGVQSNVTTETLILRLLTRAHAVRPDGAYVWGRAAKVLGGGRRSKAYVPDKKYFDALISAFAHAGNLDGVDYAFSRMLYAGIKIDVLTIRALLLGASYCGDIPLARGILDITYTNHLPPDIHLYTAAIATCARADPMDPHTAYSLLMEALERGASWSVPMVNAAIFSNGDSAPQAVELWQKLRTCRNEASRAVLKDRSVYDALMRVCGRGARPDLALRVIHAARDAKHLAPRSADSRTVFNAFRRGLVEANKLETCRQDALRWSHMRLLRMECGVAGEHGSMPTSRVRLKA